MTKQAHLKSILLLLILPKPLNLHKRVSSTKDKSVFAQHAKQVTPQQPSQWKVNR